MASATSFAVTSRISVSGVDGCMCINQYKLISHLGQGAYGEVVLAQDNTSSEYVAVKCYSKSRLLKKRDIFRTAKGMKVVTALDKAQREVLLMRIIGDHPNIVRAREVITEPLKDEMYLVLDYADAGILMHFNELKHRFTFNNTGKPLPISSISSLLNDLLQAVVHLHSLGIAHRDIKPENLLMTASGTLKLCDFGVAKHFTRTEIDASDRFNVLPTIGSPEIALSEDIRLLADGFAQFALSQSKLYLGDDDSGEEDEEPPARISMSTASPPDRGPSGSFASEIGFEKVSPTHAAAPTTTAKPKPFGWVKDTQGTFLFLCPEACSGDGYSAFAADAWAVGVTLYIMVFGIAPFGADAGHAMALFESIQHDSLEFPFENCENPAEAAADAELIDLIKRFLTRSLDERLSVFEALQHPFCKRAASRPVLKPIDPASLKPYIPVTTNVDGLTGTKGRGLMSAPVRAPETDPAVGIAPEMYEPRIDEVTVLEGWLWKRGRMMHTWRKRFFILQGNRLFYYGPTNLSLVMGGKHRRTPTSGSGDQESGSNGEGGSGFDLDARGPLQGIVDLSTIKEFDVAPKSDKPFRFFVQTPKRTLYLQADSDEQMQQWLRVFATLKALQLKPSST